MLIPWRVSLSSQLMIWASLATMACPAAVMAVPTALSKAAGFQTHQWRRRGDDARDQKLRIAEQSSLKLPKQIPGDHGRANCLTEKDEVHVVVSCFSYSSFFRVLLLVPCSRLEAIKIPKMFWFLHRNCAPEMLDRSFWDKVGVLQTHQSHSNQGCWD